MKKTEIKADYSVIDDVFSHNPHQVVVLNLGDYLQYVEQGERIVVLRSPTDLSYVVATGTGYFVTSNFGGIVNLTKEELKSRVLGVLFDDIEEALAYMIGDCQARIEEDPFTKELDSVWEWTGIVQSKGRILLDLERSLFMSFGYQNNNAIVSFCTNSTIFINGELYYGRTSNISLSQNDIISLLFEDGSVLDFNLRKRADNPDLLFCPLYKEDIDILFQNRIIKYRISFAKQNIRSVTENIFNDTFGEFLFPAMQYYIKKYVEQIKRIVPAFHFPSRTKDISIESSDFEWCCVYLMQDVSNGYYKIGISNNPEYRERTLQSEKPTIELLASKRFPTRKIAEAIESALHTTYCKQRLRGEWFNLNDEDVAAIIETLK